MSLSDPYKPSEEELIKYSKLNTLYSHEFDKGRSKGNFANQKRLELSKPGFEWDKNMGDWVREEAFISCINVKL